MDGARMRWFRQQQGWTVQELADLLGTHEQTIRQYERGLRYKDRQAVAIPKTVELALVALWASFRSFEDAFPPEDVSPATSEGQAELLTEVSQPIRDGVVRTLDKRGVKVGELASSFHGHGCGQSGRRSRSGGRSTSRNAGFIPSYALICRKAGSLRLSSTTPNWPSFSSLLG